MNVQSIQELAERVLFSENLEDKLATPDNRDWLWRSEGKSDVRIPEAPARPKELQFANLDQPRVAYPKDHQLEQAHERGALLHFLANHELLAVELMALVLLKFPDAPAAFRRGAALTLLDEQRHTRDYMERMRSFGVQFGEFQVSGFFWKMVADMSDPMDYVTRLSLTFEQANLDHSLHYSKVMEMIGDLTSAALLRQIYQDEIQHVGFGWRWFQKWKDPERSDWENYQSRLHFPLSPGRAKGPGKDFNQEGRQKSGLPEGFIQQVQLFQQSRGRAPDVFWFNPSAESFIAEGLKYQPKRARREFASDLGPLMLFLARQDDLVLLERDLSTEFLRKWKDAGVTLPEWTVLDLKTCQNGFPKSSRHYERKLRTVRPWSWSPDSSAALAGFLPQCSIEQSVWSENWKQVFSKGWSAALGKEWTEAHLISKPDRESWLAGAELYGRIASTEAEALELAFELRECGYPVVAYKALWGSSGQGTRRFMEAQWTDSLAGWIRDRLRTQGALLVEPWLERELDLSFHWDIDVEGELKYRGLVELENTPNGEYRSSAVRPALGPGLGAEVKRFIYGSPGDSRRLFRVMESMGQFLGDRLHELGYSGPFGVDTMMVRDPVRGGLRFKPLVEMNPRYSMGRLALELNRFSAPGTSVRIQVAHSGELRRRNVSDWVGFWKALEEEGRLELAGSPVSKIVNGVLPVSDPWGAQRFFAYVEYIH